MYIRLVRLIIGILVSLIGFYSVDSLELTEFFLVESGLVSFSLSEYLCRILPGLILFGGLIFALYPGKLTFSNIGAINPVIWISILVLQILSFETIPDYLPRFALAEVLHIDPFQGLASSAVLSVFFSWWNLSSKILGQFPAFLKYPAFIIALTGLFYPFIVNYPPSWQLYGEQAVKELNQTMPFDSIEVVADTAYTKAILQIKPGTSPQLMAVMSLTCPYCKLAARRLALIKKKNPDLLIWFLLTGNEAGIDEFHQRTRSSTIPFILINNPLFEQFSGPVIPRVFYVNDLMLKSEIAYWALTESRLNSLEL